MPRGAHFKIPYRSKIKAREDRETGREYDRTRLHNATHARYRGLWSGGDNFRHYTLFIARDGYYLPRNPWHRDPLIVSEYEAAPHLTLHPKDQPRTCRWCLQITEPHLQAAPITKASCYCKPCAAARRKGYYQRSKHERLSTASYRATYKALKLQRQGLTAQAMQLRIQADRDGRAAEKARLLSERLLTPPTNPGRVDNSFVRDVFWAPSKKVYHNGDTQPLAGEYLTRRGTRRPESCIKNKIKKC